MKIENLYCTVQYSSMTRKTPTFFKNNKHQINYQHVGVDLAQNLLKL